jgi:glycosyltransferase involved in cell wall biosynthesis
MSRASLPEYGHVPRGENEVVKKSSAATRPRVTTVHLVYPHGSSISTPDAIGRKVGERLERRYRVIYHDWSARYQIEPRPDEALVGHPHPVPGTVFRRSSRARDWGRVVMLAPFVDDPVQVAFEDAIIGHCDLFLAVTGPYWYSRIGRSTWSHWEPKMVHVNLAIDRTDFPQLKTRFNPQGERRFVYIGHLGHYKNTPYLGEIARRSPGVEFAWIGPGRRGLRGVAALGQQDFSTAAARGLVAGFDFLITVGRADANPTTILEAMAWGLIPVCTPHSGYQGVSGIVNVPLDDLAGAASAIRELQEMSDSDLRRIQQTNWDTLDRDFTWDRFAAQVVGAIESIDAPALGPQSRLGRLRLTWAATTSRQTSPVRYLPQLARARLRAWSRLLPRRKA